MRYSPEATYTCRAGSQHSRRDSTRAHEHHALAPTSGERMTIWIQECTSSGNISRPCHFLEDVTDDPRAGPYPARRAAAPNDVDRGDPGVVPCPGLRWRRQRRQVG